MLSDAIKEVVSRPSLVNEERYARVGHSLLDWVGVALAGSQENIAKVVARHVGAEHIGHAASLIGGARASTLGAALANGVAGHALDYDDTHLGYWGHPSATVLPAILALAQRRNSNARDMVRAIAVGMDVACRFGEAMGPAHAEAGWHPTATVGIFGAAAGALALDEKSDVAWSSAFSLCAVQAAGLGAVFGTDAKPYQVGRAAAAGLEAALLASHDLNLPSDVTRIVESFVHLHGGSLSYETLLRPEDPLGAIHFKFAPSCFGTQAPLEAGRRLSGQINGAEIEWVDITLPAAFLSICDIPDPQTDTEARFSVRLVVALSLLGRPLAGADAFAPQALMDPEARRIMARTRVLADLAMPSTAAHVRVRSTGRVDEARVDLGADPRAVAVERVRLRQKFLGLAEPLLGAQAETAADAILRTEGVDASRLFELLRASRPVSG